MKRILVILLIVGGLGAGARAYYTSRGADPSDVHTLPISRGSIAATVAATGALQAVTTVTVGSQVSGTVSWLGADFNSLVRKGQVIARLDPSLMQAQVEQSRASLMKTTADVERANVSLLDARTKYGRQQDLAERQLVPRSDLDSAKAAVDVAQAELQSAQATVVQARAALNQAQVNLNHTTIEAPIDGIVIQRSVDVGQTVAASLASPTIFVIAADLTKMQVSAAVDESDIGRIQPGEHVTFKVDAYAGESFTGTVSQVRLQATVVSNVTTYSTIIDVPNPELKLKPGMTANVSIEIAKRSDVLRVPNAALRFRPTADTFTALGQAAPPTASAPGGRGAIGDRVWTYTDGQLRPTPVHLGLTDGTQTELIDSPLEAGTAVVTGMITSGTQARTTAAVASPLLGSGPPGGRR